MHLKSNDDGPRENSLNLGNGDPYGDNSQMSNDYYTSNSPNPQMNPRQNQYNPGAMNPNQGMYNQTNMNSNQGMYNQGGMNPNQGMYNQGGMNPNQGMYNHGGSPYAQNGAAQKGINPLVIIIPIVILVIIILVSQYNRIFGQSKYIPGKLENGVLTNEYFGYKADFTGKDWEVEGYKGNDELNDLKLSEGATELYASNRLSIELFEFDVCKTPYRVKESGTDVKKLMESFKDDYVDILEDENFTVKSVETDTMTIAGKTCNGYLLTCESMGTTISVVQFFEFKGNYMCCCTAGATSQGKAKLIITNHVSKLGD